MTATADAESRAKYYGQLMVEIKERCDEMRSLLVDGPDKLRGRSRFELLYFHVRMICENLALACLVCHGASPEARLASFSDQYRADTILKILSQRSDYHYPVAVRTVISAYGAPDHFITLDPQPMPALALKKYYLKADSGLHVGRVRNTIKGTYHEYDGNYLNEFISSLIAHMNQHTIYLRDTDLMLYVGMENGKGEVAWGIFSAR